MSEKVGAVLKRLKELRAKYGVSSETIEDKLILGPGWVSRIESGKSVPNLDTLLAILDVIGSNLTELDEGLANQHLPHEMERHTYAFQEGKDIVVHFTYANHDALYQLVNATVTEFDDVMRTLRNGLKRLATTGSGQSEAIKTDAVASAFMRAVQLWPHVNPSDLWLFVVSRAYFDPFNHPATYARLDLGQSWKRTGGWALEEIVVRHYGPFLSERGIEIMIAKGAEKAKLVSQFRVDDRLEADKIDVLIVGHRGGTRVCFGVIHVKASFAERRTDDVPMSRTLIKAGYTSPLWTMDCKSAPSAKPVNHGELGAILGKGIDKRSAKRKDIEDDGYFSACFSYNSNTMPTPIEQAAQARIYVCDFKNPDDEFSRFILGEWERFSR